MGGSSPELSEAKALLIVIRDVVVRLGPDMFVDERGADRAEAIERG